MPSSSNFPFHRLQVDHVIEGGARVWWSLHPNFLEEGPYSFQLQAGKTGLTVATDWVDAGAPVINGFLAVDDQKRLHGKTLETHYRVVLSTPHSRYVSNPIYCHGNLEERDWILAREIIRKEQLRHARASHDGYLLKRLRYGRRCTRCRDVLTGEIQDSRCPECLGTGFSTGYHPPLPFQWMDEVQGSPMRETLNLLQPPGQKKEVSSRCRVLGFPMIDKLDIFVDGDSDERWAVDTIDEKASIRHVPLVLEVTMLLLPFTDVAYRIPVADKMHENRMMVDNLATAGTGSVRVNHDYGGAAALSYRTPDNNCGIAGALVYAYTKADYDAGLRTPEHAVAGTTTVGEGTWSYALCLDPGDYMLVYEMVGEWGPDTAQLTVLPEAPVVDSSVSLSEAAPPPETFSAPAAPEPRPMYADFGVF